MPESPLTPPHVVVQRPSTWSAADFPPSQPPPVQFADANLVVLDKPAGLLSVPGKGDAGALNLHRWAEAHWGPLGVVHRLDMATSGLIVFARDSVALKHLAGQFAQRTVRKRYEALAHGHPDLQEGTIDLPLAADWPRRPRQKVCLQTGRPSVTRWRLLGPATLTKAPALRCTRWALEPVTGRSHQLRVHLWATGHPIVGDALYRAGGEEDAATTPQEVTRLMLHACELTLQHPVTSRTLCLHSPVPF